jgi:hypothetical protein
MSSEDDFDGNIRTDSEIFDNFKLTGVLNPPRAVNFTTKELRGGPPDQF